MHCAVGKDGLKELEDRHEQWARRGANVKLLDAKETEAKVGTKAYAGSLLDLRAGTIQPLAYVRGLAHAAVAAGAQIFTASPVTGASEQNGKWIVKTATGTVTADWVVVATNAYTNVPWAEVRAELVHLPYFNMATKPLSDNVKRAFSQNVRARGIQRKFCRLSVSINRAVLYSVVLVRCAIRVRLFIRHGQKVIEALVPANWQCRV